MSKADATAIQHHRRPRGGHYNCCICDTLTVDENVYFPACSVECEEVHLEARFMDESCPSCGDTEYPCGCVEKETL